MNSLAVMASLCGPKLCENKQKRKQLLSNLAQTIQQQKNNSWANID